MLFVHLLKDLNDLKTVYQNIRTDLKWNKFDKLKMIPLNTNRQMLTWLCIYPTDENESQSKKLMYILFSVVVFASNLFGMAASGCYFLRYKSDSLEDSLFALVTMIGTANVAYINGITFYLRHSIVGLFKALGIFYNERKRVRMHFIREIFIGWTKLNYIQRNSSFFR